MNETGSAPKSDLETIKIAEVLFPALCFFSGFHGHTQNSSAELREVELMNHRLYIRKSKSKYD